MASIFGPGDEEAIGRAERFAKATQQVIRRQLGAGADGVVFVTVEARVIKALKFERLYIRERDTYMRLRELNVENVCGFNVPRMLRCNDDLWVVEMDIASPPYILDFAGAILDTEPESTPEMLEVWRLEKMDQFEDRWPTVRRILGAFKRMGIYLTDIHPGNISFGE